MKRLLQTVAATLLLCAPLSPAFSATPLSAEALAEDCRAEAAEAHAACLAYLAGFSDGFVSNDWIMTTYLKENVRAGYLTVSTAAERVEKPAYCVDDAVPATTLREVYLAWAAEHPEALDRPASTALFEALTEAFPCRGEALAANLRYQAASWDRARD